MKVFAVVEEYCFGNDYVFNLLALFDTKAKADHCFEMLKHADWRNAPSQSLIACPRPEDIHIEDWRVF